ncbi:TMEM175 family protein [Mycoplasma sp. P36-A1]|uniref:TMEM175 family protein n=1 Tax=Mycoplasma sp. P36-A1 TaxID=3252900 RepID=UPI003C2B4CFA
MQKQRKKILDNFDFHDYLVKNSEQSKKRLEGISDGVIAIIATITILEVPIPDSTSTIQINKLISSIIIFLVSFLLIMTLWNNQRRLLDRTTYITETFIHRNIFWLAATSLLPFFTKWTIEAIHTDAAKYAVMSYGVIYLINNIFYYGMFKSSLNARIKYDVTLNEEEVDFVKLLNSRYKHMSIIVTIGMIVNFVLANYFTELAMYLFLGIPILNTYFNVWQKDRRKNHKKYNYRG